MLRRHTLILAAALLVAACGSAATPPPSPDAASSRATSSPAASPSASPVPTPDAAATLSTALDALRTAYSFDATVTVGKTVATKATGRWVGGTSEVVVDQGDSTVTYRSIPPDAWIKEPDGTWVALDGDVPGGDPLDALRSPSSVKVTAVDASGVSLAAMYPASALGLAGPKAVKVVLRVGSNGSVTASYSTQTSSGTATSETVMRPVTGASPYPAPSLGG